MEVKKTDASDIEALTQRKWGTFSIKASASMKIRQA